MQTLKINLLKMGGALKTVSDVKHFSAEEKILEKDNGERFSLKQRFSPLYMKRGKEFFSAAFKVFFIPVVASTVLMLVSIELLVFSGIAWWIKALLFIQYLAAGAYMYDAVTAYEKRGEQNDRLKLALLLPFLFLIVSVVTLMPGGVMSSMFFSALTFFFLEESVVQEAKSMLKKGTTFWEITPLKKDESGEWVQGDNVSRYEDFYLVAYAEGGEN